VRLHWSRRRRLQGPRILHDLRPGAEHAEQSTVTVNLGGFARGCGARLQGCVALEDSPLPQGWLELEYLDYKKAWVKLFGHLTRMQRERSTFQPRRRPPCILAPIADSLRGVWVRARRVRPAHKAHQGLALSQRASLQSQIQTIRQRYFGYITICEMQFARG